MRLIDAEAIKLPKGFFKEVNNVPKFYEWLSEQPTIDAVEVVRCKDCVILQYCRFAQGLGLDGFCSQGGRKNETD